MSARLSIVTATLDPQRAFDCLDSWVKRAAQPLTVYAVVQSGQRRDWAIQRFEGLPAHVCHTHDILGVVPAYALGVQKALEDGAQIIACLHDDLLIEQDGWDDTVVNLFKACPRAGLCGFGGAKGLGSDDLYKSPYQPMQLARQGFRSNMRDAEAHGVRSEVAEPVACLDGFSQIGLAKFWKGYHHNWGTPAWEGRATMDNHPANLFQQMQQWGVIHHAYDAALGAFAKRLGYMVWYLPVACHHYGGRTAVGDSRYAEWARAQNPDGDAGFWNTAHRVVYDQFRDTLPIRV